MLRDAGWGRWAGRSLADLSATEPTAVEAWLGDPDAAPPGGETLNELLARVGAWLAAQGTAPGRVLAVTHPAVIRAAVVAAIAAGPQSFWRLDVGPLSASVLQGGAGRWTLAALNRVPGS